MPIIGVGIQGAGGASIKLTQPFHFALNSCFFSTVIMANISKPLNISGLGCGSVVHLPISVLKGQSG